MRQARDRQRESIALTDSNPDKSVANISRHRSSSKRGHEFPTLLNDSKVFLVDDTDKTKKRNQLNEIKRVDSLPIWLLRPQEVPLSI
ncbi:hypothetical protein SprV_0301338800 [Sparganum proliferum]